MWAIMSLLLDLRRDLAPYSLNPQSLHQSINAGPLLQREQLRLLALRSSCIDGLRLMIMAIIACLLYISIVVFDNRNHAAFTRSNRASTWAAGIGDASASRGRVLGISPAHEGFWSSAGEWMWSHQLVIVVPREKCCEERINAVRLIAKYQRDTREISEKGRNTT
jgi:hypothetical protein